MIVIDRKARRDTEIPTFFLTLLLGVKLQCTDTGSEAVPAYLQEQSL